MPNGAGTPKYLQHAIRLGLCGGPLKHAEERTYQCIKDLLAHKFQKAMFDHPSCEPHLQELFDSITERAFKEKAQTIEEWKKK